MHYKKIYNNYYFDLIEYIRWKNLITESSLILRVFAFIFYAANFDDMGL